MSTSTKILMRLERHIRNPPVVRQHGSTSQTQQQGTDYPSQTIVSNFGTFLEFIISMLLMANLRYPKHNVWFWLQFRHFYIFPEHYNPHSATRLSEDSQLPLWNASQSQSDYTFEARGQVHPPASMDFETASHQAYPNVLGFTNASPLTFQYNSNLFPYQQLSPFENNRPTYL